MCVYSTFAGAIKCVFIELAVVVGVVLTLIALMAFAGRK